jgi:hypothetical protein
MLSKPFFAVAVSPPRLWSVAITLFVVAVLLEDMSRQISASQLACGVAPLLLLVAVDYVVRLVRRISSTSAPCCR